ncbi:MAG: alkaline phosphatase [Desulfobacteraceae bacterium Eth-SRB1]|nr:MAG: alkaline phosphatase [Desulfobacteraceae bacterium Eth-SRB1]
MRKIVFRSFMAKMVTACFLATALLLTAHVYPVWAETALHEGTPAKYTFFFIGDGMAMSQRTAAEMYMSSKEKGSKKVLLLMNQFPAQGMTTTHAANRFITGSAAAGTALACGIKTNINYISVDPDFKTVKTMAEMAKEKGMKVGIVSSVSIDHATPASFYAHQPTRKMYHEIGMDLAKSGFDYFAGGGLKDPTGKKSKKPLGDTLRVAKKNGYRIVENRRKFMALTKRSGKVIAFNKNLPDGKALPYHMDNTSEDITLAEFTKKGIELLDNSKGFFMMVEGGKIDWACHANDAVASIKDTLAFDEAIGVAYDFYEKHPDETLIVVTGDHECGGLTLGFAGTAYASHFDILKNQKVSFKVFTNKIMAEYKKAHAGKAQFEDMIPILKKYFGLEAAGKGQLALKDYELAELRRAFIQSMAEVKINKGTADYLLYGGYDPFTVKITHVLNRKAGLAWTSYSHTGVPVLTSAIGVGAETFNGYYDNTDVAKKLMAVMGALGEMKLAVNW